MWQRLCIRVLQCLQSLQLPPSPLLVFLVSPLYAWCKLLELLQVAAHSSSRSTERFAVLGLALVGVRLQVLENQVGVAVEEQVRLRVVAFCFVDVGLSVSASDNRAWPGQRTSFCIVFAVRSQFASGMCALYV